VYIRSDPKRLAEGQTRRYLSLAHNVWESVGEGKDGKKRTRPVVFARLGAEDQLDVATVRSMRDAFDRYLQRRLKAEAAAAGGAVGPAATERAVEEVAKELRPKLEPLRFLTTREYGLRVIVEPVWKALGLRSAMRSFAEQHRLKFDFERVIFGMVLNRLVDPSSKRACNEWLQHEGYFPESEGWEVRQFYQAMDILHAHVPELERHVMAAVRERLEPGDLKLLLLDTTSSYMESDYDDVERAAIAREWDAFHTGSGPRPSAPEPQVVNEPPLRLRGHSKDKRPDKPQVVIGLVALADGRVVRHRTYAGNRSDQSITMDLVTDALELCATGRPVVVLDSGTGGGPNLKALDAMTPAPDRISAVPVRNSRVVRDEILSRPGRWSQHPTKPHVTLRAVRFEAESSPSARPELWIATRNAKEADRQRRSLDKQVERVRTVLARDDRLVDHNRAVCELQSHRTLKRYVQPSKDGKRLVLNRQRIQRERRLAGVRVLRTTLVDFDPVAVVEAYQKQLKIEDDFRMFKGPLALRPMHHRLAHRIEAHVMLCALALLCLRELERRSGRRWSELDALMRPIHATLVEQRGLRFWQRAEWGDEVVDLLGALGIKEPPRTWGAHRPPSPETPGLPDEPDR
jgi:hypothetical protein